MSIPNWARTYMQQKIDEGNMDYNSLGPTAQNFLTPLSDQQQQDSIATYNIDQADQTAKNRRTVDGVDPALANVSGFDQFVANAEGDNPWAQEHPTITKVLAAPGYAMQTVADLLPQPVQDWANRAGQTGGEVMTMADNPNKATTGNRWGDISADLAGGLMGFAANPSPGGVESMGAKLWQGAESAIGKGLTKIAPEAPQLAQTALKVGGATIPYELTNSYVNDRAINPMEMGTAAGSNVLLAGITHGLGRLGKRTEAPDENEFWDMATPEVAAPEVARANPLKTNLPFMPEGYADKRLLNNMRQEWNKPTPEPLPRPKAMNRDVDMAALPDQYPLPDVSNLEGKAWDALTPTQQAARLQSDAVAKILAENPSISFEQGIKELSRRQKEAVQRIQAESSQPLPETLSQLPLAGDNMGSNLSLKREPQPPEVERLNRAMSKKIFGITRNGKVKYAPEAMQTNPELQVANLMAQSNTGRSIIPVKNLDAAGAQVGDNIYISANTKQPLLYVTNHEIIHTLENTAPEVHARLSQIVREHVADAEGITKHYNRLGYAAEKHSAELTADTMAESMLEPSFWQRVRSQSPELLKPILETIDQIISNFKAKVGQDMTVMSYLKDIEVMRSRLAEEYQSYLAEMKGGGVQGQEVAAKMEPSFKQERSRTDDLKDMILAAGRQIPKSGGFTQHFKDNLLAAFPNLNEAQMKFLYDRGTELRKGQTAFKSQGEIVKLGKNDLAGGTVANNAQVEIPRQMQTNINEQVGKEQQKSIKDINSRLKRYYNMIDDVNNSSKYSPEEKAAMVGELEGQIKQIQAEPNYSPEARTANADQMKQELSKQAGWKDKGRFWMTRETMTRNFEDVMGKDAPEMIRQYLDPVATQEATRQRWLNKERSDIKSLGIKAFSRQSEQVQKLGEGLITEQQLRGMDPKNADKIINAASSIRGKYDQYLDEINAALARNGYDPIPKRKDYMRHFQEVNSLIEQYGIPGHVDDIPTDINGITGDFKPGKNFFASALERKGEKTAYDAIQGIDKYLEGASRLVFHTDNIQRLRGLDKAIRETNANTTHLSNFVADLTEYTNNLAGKNDSFDRAFESKIGRSVFAAADFLRKRVGANMVGANLSTALTQFIPLTQSLATTSKTAVAAALKDTVKNVAVNDGFVNRSDFLTRRIGSDPLATRFIEKASDKASWLFKQIDGFVSQVIVRGKYQEGINKGMNEQSAMKYADDWAARVMADRSLGAKPTLFNSKTLGVISQFQIEVNNQLSFLAKDIPRNYSKTAATAAIMQLFAYGYLYNNMFEKTAGYRPALDPIGVARKAWQDYHNPKLTRGKANSNLIKNIGNQLPFSSMFTGGRIPLAAAIPDVMAIAEGKSTVGKELMKPTTYALLPFGGNQVKKTYTGIKALSDKGVYYGDGKQLAYPVDPNAESKLGTAVFGPNSTKAARTYWGNNEKALSEQQTAKYQNKLGKDKSPTEAYGDIMKQREIDSQNTKMHKEVSETLKAGGNIAPIFDKYNVPANKRAGIRADALAAIKKAKKEAEKD